MAAALVVIGSSACAGEDATALSGQDLAGSGVFALEGDFVSIEKSGVGAGQERALSPDAAALPTLPDASGDFYLAIKRSALSERWFLSAYMKQFYPGNADTFGDREFGVRVVRFDVLGERLFLFDASDRFQASEVGDPELVIEAYPIVRSPSLEGLPGASDYVFIDPSRGLNEFNVSGNIYSEPYLPSELAAPPLQVGLSFTQNFRQLVDGAAFEQVFAGEIDLGTTTPDVWGTLGVTLRRYAEGEGFVPTADPGIAHYFMSEPRLVPDSEGQIASNPVRWNFYPGMEPVRFYVSAGAQRAQAANPDADVIGALRRGIESWNDVLGFRAIEAVFVDDDRVRDNDQSFFLVDYPGEGLGFARASFRTNPNTGEVRGGGVYMSGVFFDFSRFEAAPEEAALGREPAEARPLGPTLGWNGMRAAEGVCRLEPRAALFARQAPTEPSEPSEPAPLSATQQGERYIQFVAAHEMGHVLGLRHNFKGSLVPPSSSVMDYTVDELAAVIGGPREYDRSAIRYLYQQASELPPQPFCTDGDIPIDPLCAIFDFGADPLHESAIPTHELVLDLTFEGLFPIDLIDIASLNDLLGYARGPESSTSVTPADRADAIDAALGRAGVPLSEADAADPAKVGIANAVAELVIVRVDLDPVELRGNIGFDVSDPAALAPFIDQVGKLLRNEDGVRTFQLRRSAVDVLSGLQTDLALVELRRSRDAVSEELQGELSEEQRLLSNDLLERLEGALSPYYD